MREIASRRPSGPQKIIIRPDRWTMGAVVALGILVGAVAASEASMGLLLPENPLTGGELFMEKGCVGCHAIFGEGGAGGPDLGKTRLDLGFLGIAGVMWNHSPRMEEEFRQIKVTRPSFTEEEMARIITFIYFLNYFDSPGDPVRGERLFVEKQCQRCHAVGGRGGKSSKSLDRFRRYVSPLYLATAMWNEGRRMHEEMVRRGIARPSFSPGDVRDIVAYIRKEAYIEPGESQVFLPPGNPQNGERLFKEKLCTSCHNIRSSQWSAGPDLGDAGLQRSMSTIGGLLWNHGPAMWDMMSRRGLLVPRFTEKEMSDIDTYLYFIRYTEEPGDEMAGRRLFVELGCNSCHGISTEAVGDGPSVAEMERFRSPAAVIASMWNHANEMEQMTWEKNIVWPIVKDTEMADLIAFLLAASESPPDP